MIMIAFIRNHPFSQLLCCISVLLLSAAGIRFIETESGNIFIHNVDLESYEGFHYGGKFFRPVQAKSLDPYPSVMIIGSSLDDRNSLSEIASAFARQGIASLVVEDFGQGSTQPQKGFKTENVVDSAYTFLNTRSYLDPEKIGLVTIGTGADRLPNTKHLTDFHSVVMLDPPDEKQSLVLSHPYRITGSDFPHIRADRTAAFPGFALAHQSEIIQIAIQEVQKGFGQTERQIIRDNSSIILTILKPFAMFVLLISLIPLYQVLFCVSGTLWKFVLRGIALFSIAEAEAAFFNNRFFGIYFGFSPTQLFSQPYPFWLIFLAVWVILAVSFALTLTKCTSKRKWIIPCLLFSGILLLMGKTTRFSVAEAGCIIVSLLLYGKISEKCLNSPIPGTVAIAGISATKITSVIYLFTI